MLWRLLLKPSFGLFQTTQKVKASTFNSIVNTLVKTKPKCSVPSKKIFINKWSLTKVGICLAPGIGIKLSFLKSVDCEPVKQTKKVELSTGSFDWKKLLYYLSYDLWSLLGAVVAALMVAYFNIQIPFHLGNIVNIMGDILMKSETQALINEMKKASVQLVIQYLCQAVATFIYISLLSGVGERLAVKLRCELFQSILRQDLEFFDASRTGELVDCLTADVQEFKSSFKMCISQGLRSITQVTGSVATLFIISPTMTYTMLIVVPTVIIIGTMLGSLLRTVSHKAQVQVCL